MEEIIEKLADYVSNTPKFNEEAIATARLCLLDSLGCAALSLKFEECKRLLGPWVNGSSISNGARVPMTGFSLDPVQAAFNLGTMIRWLDYNDTWLSQEWGHPSDNIGGILAIADFVNRSKIAPLTVKDLLNSIIQAYEIQGILALKNSFNEKGLDHVILVKVATSGVATKHLSGGKEEIMAALSQSFADLGPLRVYRHTPNTTSRKSWAAGDQTSRGVLFALMTMRGEPGLKAPLTAPRWGFNDVLWGGESLHLERELGSYVMENILFKVSFPAEFHAQTAVECAKELHTQVKERLDLIEKIEVETQSAALKIIDKTGPLNNPADRDHCLQYMVAVALIFGTLTEDSYSDQFAKDPRIDALRKKMVLKHVKEYDLDYHHPEKRAISNALTIFFKDGKKLGPLQIDYPIGHKKRRKEALPLLLEKAKKNLGVVFQEKKVSQLLNLFQTAEDLERMRVDELVDLLIP